MYIKDEKLQIPAFFSVLIIGLLYIIAMTPFSIPDEPHHYYSSIELSNKFFGYDATDIEIKYNNFEGFEGHKNVASGYKRVVSDIADFSKTDKFTFTKFTGPHDATYPLWYMPQAIGVTIGRLLNLNLVQLFILGRFFNLLFFAFCVFIAVKTIPVLKLSILTVALLPISLQQASSFSYDGFINGVAFILIAFLLKAILSDYKITARDYWIILISSVAISPAKYVYLPLIFLFLLIPKQNFKDKKTKILMFLLILIICIFWIAIFFFRSSFIASKFDYSSLNYAGKYNYSVSDVLKNPFKFLIIYAKTIVVSGYQWVGHVLGSNLSGLSLSVPIIIPLTFGVVCLFVFFSEADVSLLNRKVRIISLLIFIAICFLIMTSMLLTWTSNDSDVIQGVQGRYFIPVIPLFVLLISNNLITKKLSVGKNKNLIAIVTLWILNCSVIISVILITLKG